MQKQAKEVPAMSEPCPCCNEPVTDQKVYVYETTDVTCEWGCAHEIEHEYVVCLSCHQRCPMTEPCGEWKAKHKELAEGEEVTEAYRPPKEQMPLPAVSDGK